MACCRRNLLLGLALVQTGEAPRFYCRVQECTVLRTTARYHFGGATYTTTFNMSDVRDHAITLGNRDLMRRPIVTGWTLVLGLCFFGPWPALVGMFPIIAFGDANGTEPPAHLVVFGVLWFLPAMVIGLCAAYGVG